MFLGSKFRSLLTSFSSLVSSWLPSPAFFSSSCSSVEFPLISMVIPFFRASAVSSACFLNPFRVCSVFVISLCSARYCSSDTSPRANCSCTCFSASFSTSSCFPVFSICCVSSFCFCSSNSVFLGSNFRSLLTSFSSLVRSWLPSPAFFSSPCSFVESPSISIVIPLIVLFPIYFPSFPYFSLSFLLSGFVCVILQQLSRYSLPSFVCIRLYIYASLM